MEAINVLWILAILGGFLYVSFELGKIRERLSINQGKGRNNSFEEKETSWPFSWIAPPVRLSRWP